MKLTDFNNELYVKTLEARCARLEKAFDKACDYLSKYGNGDEFLKMNEEQWKEWCLKDE